MNIRNLGQHAVRQRSCQILATVLILLIVESVSAQSRQELRTDSKDAWLRGPIVWNQVETEEGLLVGVRVHPRDGVLRVGQPLELQCVLKNCSKQPIELSLTSPVKAFMFDLQSGNTLMATRTKRSAELHPTRIAAGEVFDKDSQRTIIQTTGLTEGEYTLPILPVFSTRPSENRTTSSGIGYVQGIRFRIEAPGKPEGLTRQPETGVGDSSVKWGEEIAGMQLGAQLVRLEGEEFVSKSGRFHAGETMELQLGIRNNTDRDATLEIRQPPKGRTWLLRVKDLAGVTKKVAVPVAISRAYRPRIRLDLAPGVSRTFTATRVKMATSRGDSEELTTFKNDSISNARLDLLSTRAPIELLDAESAKLEAGSYFVQVEVKAKYLGSDFTLVLKSGDVPFRIARKLGGE